MFSANTIKEVRIFWRIIKETVKGIIQTGLMNIMIIGTMVAILTIFGCMLRVGIQLSAFADSLGKAMEISVYIKNSASVEKVTTQVKNISGVEEIKVITKQRAWLDLRRQMNVPEIQNPLPNTLHVKIVDPKNLGTIAGSIKEIPGVEEVRYAKQLADKMQNIRNITHTVTLVIVLFFGGLTVFIINNTIHLVMESRKQEIEIMRMTGVYNWYIRSPYLLQGAFYGFSGALLSIIPLNLLNTYLDNASEIFNLAPQVVTTNMIILLLLIMGIIFGAGGSLISIKKYLKV